MTPQEDANNQETESAPQENPSYVVDPSRADELGRSLITMLLSRRCPSCHERLEAKGETPSVKEQIREIAKCCATQEGFIRPEMPMQEIVFRALLSKGNRPADLKRLHHLVTYEYYSPTNPRHIGLEGMKRVLDSDAYYGIVEVSA